MGDITGPIAGSGQGSVQKLAASAIPFIIAPTGSMANNGAITLGTALPVTYASCYLALPAGAISSGSAAGWYYTVMSSATVGQVYNNTYSSGAPTIPGSPTPFATTGPGAYTGITTLTTGPQITVPGGAMGPNGILRLLTLWSTLSNADAKTMIAALGGAQFLNAGLTTSGAAQVLSMVYNRGNAAINLGQPSANNAGLGTFGANIVQLAVNTALAQTLAISGQLATATDFLILESFLAEVIPG
jgi:hypothetical protein